MTVITSRPLPIVATQQATALVPMTQVELLAMVSLLDRSLEDYAGDFPPGFEDVLTGVLTILEDSYEVMTGVAL